MGKRGGWREGGGRPKGSKNKATIEREEMERQQIAAMEARHSAARQAKRLGKTVLEELMEVAMNYAAIHQPKFDPVTQNVVAGNEAKFIQWATLAAEWAGRVVKYQSPSFKAITYVTAPPIPEMPSGPIIEADAEDDTENVIRITKTLPEADKLKVYERIVRRVGRG